MKIELSQEDIKYLIECLEDSHKNYKNKEYKSTTIRKCKVRDCWYGKMYNKLNRLAVQKSSASDKEKKS